MFSSIFTQLLHRPSKQHLSVWGITNLFLESLVCMFAEDCIKWEGWSDSACGYRGGAVPQSTAELCFVNTRVNFAQGASLLEMLRGEIRVCNVICAAGVCVIHFTTKPTEISASWSMSEQALQGQLIQRSGLQSCWDKQKTDALLGIWHLSSQVLLCQGTTQQLYSLLGVNLTVL